VPESPFSGANCPRRSRCPSGECRCRHGWPGTRCSRTSRCNRRRRGSRPCRQLGARCRRPSHRFGRKPACRRSRRTSPSARGTAGSRIHRTSRRSRRDRQRSRRFPRFPHCRRYRRRRRRLSLWVNPSWSRRHRNQVVQRPHIRGRPTVHSGPETVIFSHVFSCAPLMPREKARIRPKVPDRVHPCEICEDHALARMPAHSPSGRTCMSHSCPRVYRRGHAERLAANGMVRWRRRKTRVAPKASTEPIGPIIYFDIGPNWSAQHPMVGPFWVDIGPVGWVQSR
jgi:hypothetical protein